jgi:hypothetical protein
LATIATLIYSGLQVITAPFGPIPTQSQQLNTLPIPNNLPQPVERFYRLIYGDEIPVIETAVLSGSAKLTFNKITFPARFRFTHNVGRDNRRNIELA